MMGGGEVSGSGLVRSLDRDPLSAQSFTPVGEILPKGGPELRD
jgi:hypothetical protein